MQFKVISLNIWHGGRLLDKALEFIRSEAPDILALQEVYDSSDASLERRLRCYSVLQQELPELPYHVFDAEIVDNLSVGKVPQGNAIFSRFPITAKTVDYFLGPMNKDYVDHPDNYGHITRNLQRATIKTPAGDINFCNFHGVYDLVGENDSPDRQKMADAVLRAVSDTPRSIVTGDTNAKPVNPAMQRISAVLTSVFDDSLVSTFNMRRKDNPGYATAVVDMMFTTPDLRVISRSVPNVDISDHLPLVVTLEV